MMTYKAKKSRRFVLLALFLVLLLPALAFAGSVDVRDNDNVVVAAGETIESAGIYAGNTVVVDGTVNGTMVATAQEVVVNGTINGDLIAMAQTVTVRGKINGNVIGAGQTVSIANEVGGNVYAAGQNVSLNDKAVVERDAFLAAASVQVTGKINRDLFVGANTTNINSEIARHATLGVESMTFGPAAKIKGDLTYGTNASEQKVRDGVVEGNVQTYQVDQPKEKQDGSPLSVFLSFLWSLAAALLVWLIMELLRKNIWIDFSQKAIHQPLKGLGIGILAGLIVIPLSILLFITVIGVPAGLILLAVASIFAYLGRIFVAVALVEYIVAKRGLNRALRGFWLILMLLILWTALSMLPVVGFIVKILSTFYAFGVLVLFFKKNRFPKDHDEPSSNYQKIQENAPTAL